MIDDVDAILDLKAGFPFVNSVARRSDGLSRHEIRAESERLLANARSVLEVKSSSTFSRLEVSEYQSDCFFSMVEHTIVPVRAFQFAEHSGNRP